MTRSRSKRGSSELPVVALIGRPNVGKSSLFNRMVGGRPALVEDRPGVTRDRRYGEVEWDGRRFRVVDTGGLDPSADGILGAMRAQTLRAVDEAAAIVFMVDGAAGITGPDHDVAALLRRTGKPVLLAVNKVDSERRDVLAADAWGLGYQEVFPTSAAHGRGVGDLLDALVRVLGDSARVDAAVVPEGEGANGEGAESAGETEAEADSAGHAIRIAFVGKPNVGKSSLVNRLLGQERVLVHDSPGTTRDPVDTPFSIGGREFVLVDTAGMRRRRAIDTVTEAVAAKMARDQLDRADVAALVIDGREGATAEDARLASLIDESGRAVIVVLNKTDLVPRAELDKRIESTREELGFMAHAPILLTSAATGRGVISLPTAAARAHEQWTRRVPTAELNRMFEELVARRPPPAGPGGRYVRLYYATQAGVRPPTFYVSTNQPSAVDFSYRRFLANQIRKSYGFEGTPIRVAMRAHRQDKGRAARVAAPVPEKGTSRSRRSGRR